MKLMNYLVRLVTRAQRTSQIQRDITKANELIELMAVNRSLQAGRK